MVGSVTTARSLFLGKVATHPTSNQCCLVWQPSTFVFREAACQARECSVQQVICYAVKGPVWIQRTDMLIFLKMNAQNWTVMGFVFFHQANVDFKDAICFMCNAEISWSFMCSLVSRISGWILIILVPFYFSIDKMCYSHLMVDINDIAESVFFIDNVFFIVCSVLKGPSPTIEFNIHLTC